MRSSGARRHFERFDEELQDSDQTISAPVGRLGPRARLPTTRSSRREHRRFPPSAFFSDTTDDDASYPRAALSDRHQLSMSAYSRPAAAERAEAPLHMSAGPQEGRRRSAGARREETRVPRLHVDAIQFPVTRSVLWDRRPLSAAQIGVSLGQVLPRFVVTADALKKIYKLYQEWTETRRNGAVLGYLCGDTASPRLKTVKLEEVALKKEDARTAAWCIPVVAIVDGSHPGLSQESYTSAIASVLNSYRDEYADNVGSKVQPKLLVFRTSPHAAQLDFQLECAASPVLFKFSLVRNLPLLMTPLAASLARREFSTRSKILRSGYLTLDRTRKAVPLLKVDPLVLQQPIVGIWVYGVQIDDAWDEETVRRQLADPFLYFACIGYLMSEVIKERVGPAKNTFLVALYSAGDSDNGSTGGSLPRFFECSFSEYLSPPTTPLPMELYSHQRSCLVGVSKFSSDIELMLCASPTREWEAARKEAKIPTAPCSADDQDPNSSETQIPIDNNAAHSNSLQVQGSRSHGGSDESEDLTSGWTITAEAVPTHAPADPSQLPREDEGEADDAKRSAQDVELQAEDNSEELPPGVDNLCEPTSTEAAEEAKSPYTPNVPENEKHHRQDHTNDKSYRSCCKSQQLLTIQHQQILENQQRQLHEMQEQIAQLRRLLDAARSKNSKPSYAEPNDDDYESDASSSSIGAVADVSGTFSRNGRSILSSQSSGASASPQHSGNIVPTASDKGSIHTPQADENEGSDNDGDADDKNVTLSSLSSLNLSSLSNDSVDVELSSLSSSIVGERLESSQSHGEKSVGDVEANSSVEALSLSQLSKTSSKAKEVGAEPQSDVQATNLSEHAKRKQERDGDKGSADVVKSTGDSPLVEEASNDTATKGNQTGYEEGDDRDADASGDDRSMVERLLSPDAYLRKVGGFVDHHGGCYTTPTLDFHSFCVPRIKFSTESSGCSLSDSEDEEIRLIEQKYKRLMAA